MQEFKFSQAKLQRRLRFLLIGSLVALAVAVLVLHLLGRAVTMNLLTGMATAALILYIVMDKAFPSLIKRMIALKVLVNEDRIIKQFGQSEQIFLWADITRVKLTKNQKGEVEAIKIHGKDKKMIYLNGLEDMDELARLIFEKTHIIPQ